jgi:hypothetical protein
MLDFLLASWCFALVMCKAIGFIWDRWWNREYSFTEAMVLGTEDLREWAEEHKRKIQERELAEAKVMMDDLDKDIAEWHAKHIEDAK